MDPIATSFTVAWLDAVRRVQSERIQNLEEIMPQSAPSDRLTDIIEGALKSGGAEPVMDSDTDQRTKADVRPSIHLVDVLV